jgi:ADP-ribosylglycohydrolase
VVANFAPLSQPSHTAPRAVAAAIAYAFALVRYAHVTPADVAAAKGRLFVVRVLQLTWMVTGKASERCRFPRASRRV